MRPARYYYTYNPVHGAPEAAAVVFAAVAGFIWYKTAKTNSPKWVHILTGTALAESIGYVLRAVTIEHASLGLYIAMMLFLLLPPNAFALFEYKTLGEIVRRSDVRERRPFWLRPKFVTWFYFSSDVFSFMLQSVGGSMMSQRKTADTGKKIALGGLAIQLAFLSVFLYTVIVVLRDPLYTVSKGPKDVTKDGAKKKLLYNVIATTLLIFIRSIYRLVEFADGYGGKIYSAEWAFYVFDTIIILAAFVLNIFYFAGHHFSEANTGSMVELNDVSA
ncbi:hypothetical protein GGI12_004811 [Dipsacomyces acuminosporus]|nr:hypothetical protein GGI12_004811 [Dipsacomyces acuminosporus]